MKREHIDRIPPPFQASSVGPDDQTAEFLDSSRRRVVAGQPLRIEKGELFASTHRHAFTNVENVPLDVGCVHVKTDRAGVRYVFWLRHRALLGERGGRSEN